MAELVRKESPLAPAKLQHIISSVASKRAQCRYGDPPSKTHTYFGDSIASMLLG
jgi:hypothetical protein